MTSQKIGLRSPRFVAYLGAQFLGVVNDNAFKMTMLWFLYGIFSDESVQFRLSSFATLLFPVPFLLFSQVAGYLADRYRKDRVLLATKLPEIVAMALGTLGFHWRSPELLFVVLFLMATQSAFFSPSKYGILPEVFSDRDLSQANGILGMTTNLATLLGTVSGPLLYVAFKDDLPKLGWLFVGVACLGALTIALAPRGLPGARGARRPGNPLRVLRADYREVRQRPALGYTVAGLAYFALLGALLLTVVPIYGINVLGLAEARAGLLVACLAVGIALGALLAGRLSQGHVEIGLVPLGAVGMGLFALDLAAFGGHSQVALFGMPVRASVDLAALGASGALFNVPLLALLQQRSPREMKGRIIAFSNVASFSAVLLAAGFAMLLTQLETFRIEYVLFALALMTLVGTVYVLRLLPDFFVRLNVWILMNLLYRIRVSGHENIPQGGALLVANHVSWVDALILTAASGRMVRFLIHRPYFETLALGWFFRLMHAIPVAGGEPASKTHESLERARSEILSGEVVCIFAEGAITRTGNLLRFRRGLERIASGIECPIVPVCLDGLWGSIFSWEGGRLLLKRPRRFRHRISVLFGDHLPSDSSAFAVRSAVQELSAEAFEQRRDLRRPLPVELLAAARRYWWRPLVAEEDEAPLRFAATFRRALKLRDGLFGDRVGTSENVGILLPPGVRALIANLAVLFAGKVPVNLPELSPSAISNAIVDAGIARVLTTRRIFETHAGGTCLRDARPTFLEEEEPRPTLLEFPRYLLAHLVPLGLAARLLMPVDPRSLDRPAAVLFSRGTTGVPKSIVISQSNVLCNVEALRQVFDIGPDDQVLGVMPLSHASGFIATLCLPILSGSSVVYNADPMDVEGIERSARAHRITMLFSTPYHLERYLLGIGSDALGSLRRIVAGGGLLPDRVRSGFERKLGVEVLEGYGCSECTPIISLNVPDVPGKKAVQPGHRPGTIGQPLPGIAARILDPETGGQLGPGAPGRLWVRGPHVMRGYLRDGGEEPGTSVEGWLDTGDLAEMDEDGFLRIVDRADRVVEVRGGEVPLGRLEHALREAMAADGCAGGDVPDRVCAIASRLPDGARELVVVYEEGALEPSRAAQRLAEMGLPPHWIPAAARFRAVSELPRRETGHIDLEGTAELAGAEA